MSSPAVVFDPNGYSIPGERTGWCLDCSAFFFLPKGHCSRCGSASIVGALAFMNALVKSKALPAKKVRRTKTNAPAALTTEA